MKDPFWLEIGAKISGANLDSGNEYYFAHDIVDDNLPEIVRSTLSWGGHGVLSKATQDATVLCMPWSDERGKRVEAASYRPQLESHS